MRSGLNGWRSSGATLLDDDTQQTRACLDPDSYAAGQTLGAQLRAEQRGDRGRLRRRGAGPPGEGRVGQRRRPRGGRPRRIAFSLRRSRRSGAALPRYCGRSRSGVRVRPPPRPGATSNGTLGSSPGARGGCGSPRGRRARRIAARPCAAPSPPSRSSTRCSRRTPWGSSHQGSAASRGVRGSRGGRRDGQRWRFCEPRMFGQIWPVRGCSWPGCRRQ